MGHHIDTYCKGAAGIGAIYDAAAEKIKLGPIAIGEWHAKPHGRAIVYDLIEAGFVRLLFIELPDTPFGKELRNANLGKQPQDWPESSDKFIFDMGVNFADSGHGNTLPMLPLIRTAASKGVKIYFYDIGHEKPTSSHGMQARNEGMAKVFLKKTSPTETKQRSSVGAVALVGGKHLETPVDDVIYTLALQAACNIPHDHVFNVFKM